MTELTNLLPPPTGHTCQRISIGKNNARSGCAGIGQIDPPRADHPIRAKSSRSGRQPGSYARVCKEGLRLLFVIIGCAATTRARLPDACGPVPSQRLPGAMVSGVHAVL